jgi:menaquinone-dependent protoporphyrinogen IX oxidase
MGKTIVIFKSKTGFTQKYVEWIGEELQCEVMDLASAKKHDLEPYDTFIYGGSLYASGVLGLKEMMKKMDVYHEKNLIVFAVGATPYTDTLEEELANKNIPQARKHDTRIFYFRGGFNLEKLNMIDRKLMLMMKKIISKKPENQRTDDETGLLEAFDQPVDFTNRDEIKRLLEYHQACSRSTDA